MNKRILIPTIFGQEIGVLMEGKNGISFQFHPHFDAQRCPISPLRLPYDPVRVFNYYDSMPFDGLPGIFADSLPDSFGNIALRAYFKRKYRTSHLKLSPLEKLAYVGNHGKRFMKETTEQSSDQFSKLPILLKETDISADLQKELLGNITPVSISTFPEKGKRRS